MVIKLRTKHPDSYLKQIIKALGRHDAAHPKAVIEAYQQNSVSVRLRIIDADFKGAEISLLLLLTPEEAKSSFASFEFDDPIPSKL